MRRLVLLAAALASVAVAPPAAAAPTAVTCDVRGAATEGFSSLTFMSTTATCGGAWNGAPSLATYSMAMSLPGGGPSPCTAVLAGTGSFSMTRTSLVFGSAPAQVSGAPQMTRVGLEIRLTGAVGYSLTGHLHLMPTDPLGCAAVNPSYLVTGTVTFTDAAATTAAS